MTRFAEYLCVQQARSGLSWYRIAKDAGLALNGVLALRDGKRDNPQWRTVEALTRAMGATLAEFLAEGDDVLALRYWREELPEGVRAAYRERAAAPAPEVVLRGAQPRIESEPEAAEREAWTAFTGTLDRERFEEAVALMEAWSEDLYHALGARAEAEIARRTRRAEEEARRIGGALRRRAGAPRGSGKTRRGAAKP